VSDSLREHISGANDAVPLNKPHLIKPHASGYIAGFVLAVILTAVPFGVAGYGLLDRNSALFLISVLAAVQAIVHVRYFLHWSSERTPFEATVALVLSTIITVIMIGGCMWVMSDLHERMMP
jgi:cytochrome o ubiquinol oxidase subunit IV